MKENVPHDDAAAKPTEDASRTPEADRTPNVVTWEQYLALSQQWQANMPACWSTPPAATDAQSPRHTAACTQPSKDADTSALWKDEQYVPLRERLRRARANRTSEPCSPDDVILKFSRPPLDTDVSLADDAEENGRLERPRSPPQDDSFDNGAQSDALGADIPYVPLRERLKKGRGEGRTPRPPSSSVRSLSLELRSALESGCTVRCALRRSSERKRLFVAVPSGLKPQLGINRLRKAGYVPVRFPCSQACCERLAP